MRPLHIAVLLLLLPFTALAQDAGTEAPPFGPLPAAEVVFADQLYVKRPIVVFADSPNDPNFARQMEHLARQYDELASRDVILITDTDPAAKSEWRQKLRPRGFSLVIMDKDLKPVVRKPSPWTVREITAAIDKLPLRRQEMLEANPAGR
jgi:Domain of unknown function (DUF4174)